MHEGSHHPALPVPAYGGDLFALGDAAASDGLVRALAVFESAALEGEVVPDRDVLRVLERLTRTRVKVKQGRTSTMVTAPVDFGDLSSEYIGILYEGLLDFELKTAPGGDPVVFLAVGNQPALPLSRLEAMNDAALRDLLEKMKDTSSKDDDAGDSAEEEVSEETDEDEDTDEEASADAGVTDEEEEAAEEGADERLVTRTRAEQWARRAVEAGKLVRRPVGAMSPEKRRVWEDSVARKARQLVVKVVLPGEWYVVRWGGTRKGSGTFYTRPGLAIPTVHRTLRPLAYLPPADSAGAQRMDAPALEWTPRLPEEILALQVCDPACGSGTFPVAALRFLTDALYASLHHHDRVVTDSAGDRAVVNLLAGPFGGGSPAEERLGQELLPTRPDDPSFEPRLRAVLRRHVVERCIYGVDLDPLAVELCRLALWIETMDRTLPFSFLDHKIKCGNGLIGAWFDQFQHFPVMAWKNREGGDKNHSNGVHYEKEARTKVVKAFVKSVLTPDLLRVREGRAFFFEGDEQEQAGAVHDAALATLARLHELPVHNAAERARVYREELMGAPAYRALKNAMDLWCACWFWPVDELACAPLASTIAAPDETTRQVASRVAARHRFLHWELEFPDVFRTEGDGFDAILGNPPWDIAKPNSKEFFSNIDPLYRSYGKQEALQEQKRYFAAKETERAWLDYNADLRAQSNFMAYAASPFGDPTQGEGSQDRFALGRGDANEAAHASWRRERKKSRSYSQAEHAYRHQGSADLNLYKLFLEQAHALLGQGGRLGFIVPSGLYSDHGTGGLRRLFLDQCQWEWLFGFENRDKVFDIDSRFKFNAVIVQKGGTTAAIRTAFMRRKLEDWERAEEFATPYARAQVERFSPYSKAILEIQSSRDLEILEKIYSNSVLLGDEGPDGWGISYAREFDMTNDSKLFPPRPKWEEQGYRPDEYSRWLKGDWRPIAELWPVLGIDPAHAVSVDPACQERMKSPDVQRTEWRVRCAQPPYDALPIPRADIPAGIVLSREGDAFVREDAVQDVALPLFEGRMVGQLDCSAKGWVSGKGRGSKWRGIPHSVKQVEPQYLMGRSDYLAKSACPTMPKLAHMRIGSATNNRSAIGSPLMGVPCGDTAATFFMPSWRFAVSLAGLFNSFAFDFVTRRRLVGLHLDYHVFAQNPLPRHWKSRGAVDMLTTCSLVGLGAAQAPLWLASTARQDSSPWRAMWAVTDASRLRARAVSDAVSMAQYGLSAEDALHIVHGTDLPRNGETHAERDPKGFWREGADTDPELRQAVLAVVALADLTTRSLAKNATPLLDEELATSWSLAWMLPHEVRLADHGLGRDDRAHVSQPVASRLGPRFYDWQLSQGTDESWRECRLHARNLLGEEGCQRLIDECLAEERGDWTRSPALSMAVREASPQASLFE